MKFKYCRIHPEKGSPFELELNKKITVLLGKNGDGKTTLLRSIEAELQNTEIKVINDDARERGDDCNNIFDPAHILFTRFSSEGETLFYTIGMMIKKIGYYVRQSKKVVVCLDKVDSGLSIDKIKEAADFIKESLIKDIEMTIISANSYELASQFKGIADFYWVKKKAFIELPNTYEEFIKLYFPKHKKNKI